VGAVDGTVSKGPFLTAELLAGPGLRLEAVSETVVIITGGVADGCVVEAIDVDTSLAVPSSSFGGATFFTMTFFTTTTLRSLFPSASSEPEGVGPRLSGARVGGVFEIDEGVVTEEADPSPALGTREGPGFLATKGGGAFFTEDGAPGSDIVWKN